MHRTTPSLSHAHSHFLGSLLADGQRGRCHPAASRERAGEARPFAAHLHGQLRTPGRDRRPPRGTPVDQRPVLSVSRYPVGFPRARDIEDDLAAFQPDVVHVATEFAMGLAGLKAAERLGIPVISSAHTDYQKYAYRYGVPWVLDIGWIYGRWFYNRTAKVLCPSRLYEEYLHTRGILHTGVWTRGVDPEEFNPAFRSESYRQSFGVGPDDLLVTYIGRLAKEKGFGPLAGRLAQSGKPERQRSAGAGREGAHGRRPGASSDGRSPSGRSPAWPRAGRGLCLRRSLRVPLLAPKRSATRSSKRWGRVSPHSPLPMAGSSSSPTRERTRSS